MTPLPRTRSGRRHRTRARSARWRFALAALVAGAAAVMATTTGPHASAVAPAATAPPRRAQRDVGSAPDPRRTIDENHGWRFALNPAGSPEDPGFDDRAWAPVDLPHCWNGVDGASLSYATGDGWYRKSIDVGADLAGRRLYLRFDGASIVTTLFVDGTPVVAAPSAPGVTASHEGAFQTFVLDVTRALTPGRHLVAVRVNNEPHADVPPASGGDYSKLGGLYRDVTLVVADPVHIALTVDVAHPDVSPDAPASIATPGITFSHGPVTVGTTSVDATVATLLDNDSSSDRSVRVTATIASAGGDVVARATAVQMLRAGDHDVRAALASTIAKPHLWDGRLDPYRYDVFVRVSDAGSGRVLDAVHQKVGIRSVTFNATPDRSDPDPGRRAPFLLNGHPYVLVGVDMHQDSGRPDPDGRPVGWAQTPDDIRADVAMAAELGATIIRTSHYQDSQVFYDACDEHGLLVYTESPVNGSTNASAAFLTNALDQYAALIVQNVDHPSIIAWGLGNETRDSPTNRTIFGALDTLAHRLDRSRPTGLASNGGRLSTPDDVDGIPDIKGTHPYDYWYGPSGPIQRTHDAFPAQPLGVTEFGAGGSAYQYLYPGGSFTLPVARGLGTTSHFHPANQQTRIEETQFTDLGAAPFLWGRIVWQMFDMASSGRDEGDHPGVNDKGLVTRDRIRKDAFYFYEASWNDPTRRYANARVLRISDRFWTVRNHPTAQVTVFSNVGIPTLNLNGRPLGPMAPLVVAGHAPTGDEVSETVPRAFTATVTLAAGDNTIEARRTGTDGRTDTDSVVWSYRDHLEGMAVARIDFTPRDVPPAPGYQADHGDAFAAHGADSYGWTTAPGETFGAASGDPAATGVNVGSSTPDPNGPTWEYAVPDGIYDVRIGAGQPNTHDSINQFRLEGHAATTDDDGPDAEDTFFTRVRVSDGRLTLAVAPGSVSPRITYIDINRVAPARGE